jgi:hypothetical protein
VNVDVCVLFQITPQLRYPHRIAPLTPGGSLQLSCRSMARFAWQAGVKGVREIVYATLGLNQPCRMREWWY